MTDHIVFDVEIMKSVDDLPGGWDATDQMGVAVAVVYEYEKDRFRVYGDTPVMLEALRKRIKSATRVSGFNIVGFDYPVVWSTSRKDWKCDPDLLGRSNDILRRIWLAEGLDPDHFVPRSHGGFSLDAVADVTLGGIKKIGKGADAPKWYKAGDWSRVVTYCIDDVAIERDLINFVDQHGYVVSPRTGRKIPLAGTSGR
jgi:hypothetical protein